MEVSISEKDIISPSFVDAWCEIKDKVTVGDMRSAAESGKTPFELIWFEHLPDFGEEKSLRLDDAGRKHEYLGEVKV